MNPAADASRRGAPSAAEGSAGVAVGLVMGSWSDWDTMSHAASVLDDFDAVYEQRVVSAHRTPRLVLEYAESAAERGLRVIIAGAGGAAHLPGMLAASTVVPVLGVPVKSSALSGFDSLLSIVQMPRGVPVGAMAIGPAGAANAALLAVQMLAVHDERLRSAIETFRARQTARVLDNADPSSPPE